MNNYNRKAEYEKAGLWKTAFMQECALAQVKAGIPPELIVTAMIEQYANLWERIDAVCEGEYVRREKTAAAKP